VPSAPVVSVVVPCFNHGRFLREAVDSVGTQGVATEIIVVDDGSTDDTPAVAEAWISSTEGGARGRIIRQPNGGLAAARNRGLRESLGRYLVFLDADDRLEPGALGIGSAALDAHPECGFVFGRCHMMAADGTLLATPSQPRVDADHYRELLRRNYIWMPATVMFRRDAVELAGGFNTDVNAAADYELYLRIARVRPVHDHAAIVALYRQHETNMSRNASRMLHETLGVLRRQRPLLEGDPASLAAYAEGWRTWQEFYGTHLVNEIRAHVAAAEWGRAARKTLTLARYHPRGLGHHAVRKLRLTFGARTT